MRDKGRYIQFPLSLLRCFCTDKNNTIIRILNFGIYHYSKKFDFNIKCVAQQIVYDNYRGYLTNDIINIINSYDLEYFGLDEDYNGFDTRDGFSPLNEINELLCLYENNELFKSLSIEYYRVHLALQSLKISASNIDSLLLCAKRTESNIKEKEPLPMVNIQLLFDFMEKENEFDIIQLLCYISLKSILCKKSYCKSNKNHVLFRMFGYNSSKDTDIDFNTKTKELFSKYEKRYHFDKLMNAMQLNWNILYYSFHNRGFYIGNSKLTTIDEIIKKSIMNKQSNKIEALKKMKTNTRNKILNYINQVKT